MRGDDQDGGPRPTIAQSRAKKIAFVAVAAPPIFVFAGVVMYMLHVPIQDTWAWSGAWTVALLWVATGSSSTEAKLHEAASLGWLRVSHGVSALHSRHVLSSMRSAPTAPPPTTAALTAAMHIPQSPTGSG